MMRDCFKFEFPISFTMPDASVITIEDADSWSLIKDWHQANPEIEEKGDINFPVVINFDDETSLTVNTEEEMQAVRQDCKVNFEKNKGEKGKKCFEFIYPITYTMPDASEIVLVDRESRSLIKEWYESNPDIEEKPTLLFPVDIQMQDESVITINSEEEFDEIRNACKESSKEQGGSRKGNGQKGAKN